MVSDSKLEQTIMTLKDMQYSDDFRKMQHANWEVPFFWLYHFRAHPNDINSVKPTYDFGPTMK